MELHRIIAPDASKATAEALRLYGPEALILSTRRLKNDRTEVIVATEAPPPPAAQGSGEEAMAFKRAFEAQLETALLPPTEPVALQASATPRTKTLTPPPAQPEVEAKQATSKALTATAAARALAKRHRLALHKVAGTGRDGQITQQDVQRALRKTPASAQKPKLTAAAPEASNPATAPKALAPALDASEGLELLSAIHEELARLREELGALKAERQGALDAHAQDRLEALGFNQAAREALRLRMERGDLPGLPKLSEGAAAQARWLSVLLYDSAHPPADQGLHILRAEDAKIQAEMAVALARQAELREGVGSSLLIAFGQDKAHWQAIARCALEDGIQVLRANDPSHLTQLLEHKDLGQGLRLVLPASGEQADLLRQIRSLSGVLRHQIVPAARLGSPFNGALLKGSETDAVMIQGFHKQVPLDHFIATMLEAGKPLSALGTEGLGLQLGETASLTLMSAWAERDRPVEDAQRNIEPWPRLAQG